MITTPPVLTRWLLPLLLTATLPFAEALTPPALAQALPAGLSFGYTPPDRGAPRRTRGAGSRGCSNTDNAELQLLIPSDHTGQTLATHPTLFWHLSEPVSVPLEVTLIDPDSPEPLYSETLTSDSSGIMQVVVPDSAPELALDKEYSWSVALVCNPARPSANVFVQGRIRRIAVPAELASLESEPLTTAQAYAQAGVWFDTLETLHTADLSEAQAAFLAEGGIEDITP